MQSYSIVSTFCWPKWCNFVQKLEKEIAVEKGLQCALPTVKEHGLKSMLTI